MIGQEEAVSAISRAVKRSRVGFKDPSRPIATMLFCGPTGVGKTELAKSLAACYFGSVRLHIQYVLALILIMRRHLVHVTSIVHLFIVGLSYYYFRKQPW